jgi:DNA processing protein
MEIKTNNFPVQELKREDFPTALAQIPNAPEALYYRGTLPSFERSWIAMVGTRLASPNAEEICQKLVQNLSGTDAVVVSGLAQGIDTFCHSAAIQFRIPTVAVIAQGIEAEITGSRRSLAHRILQEGGAILSEYPGKTASLKFMFPMRNRIIAGLSQSLTLVESKLHGGGMISVDYAKDFSKKILAVPGSILAPHAEGPNFCIASKIASAIWNTKDFSDLCGAKRLTDHSATDLPQMGISLSPKAQKLFFENAGFTHSLDELCTSSSLPISELLAILTEMEIAGIVHSKDGNSFHFSQAE